MSNGLPIITKILNGFELAINTIEEINQVIVYPSNDIDRETAVFPITFIFEVPLSWAGRNQFEHNTSTMVIETWYENTEGEESNFLEGKLLESLIHRAIFGECGRIGLIGQYIENIKKIPPEYSFADDVLSAVVQRYEVAYLTLYGDPFKKNP